MKGILADYNISGQVRLLVETFYASKEWTEFWNFLGLPSQTFADVGLDRRAPDDVVWQTCQDNGLDLVTGNRNADGPTSLEVTIRERLRPESLPVITGSQPKSLGVKPAYTAEVGIKILQLPFDIEFNRGTGRLYVP